MSPQQHQKLSDHLNKEMVLAQDLNRLLDEEYQLLSHKNPELIADISKQKQNLVLEIEKANKIRTHIIASAGFPNQPENITTLVSQLQEDDDIAITWHKVIELIASIRQQNIINGGIIQVSLQRNRSALAILTGRQQQDSGTYSSIGKAQDNHQQGISLARA